MVSAPAQRAAARLPGRLRRLPPADVGYSGALADGRSERHVLIDCGTKSGAKGGPSMAKLAPKIAEHCGGHLDAVVATHRHADHVGGFGGAKAEEHLGPLQPGLIIRPWTDGPADAPAPDGEGLGVQSVAVPRACSTRSPTTSEGWWRSSGWTGATTAGRVGELAALSVANQDSLDMLGTWTTPDPTVWVRADDQLDTQDLLPGVGIRVLGPPTLEQVPKMRSYASTSAEYWLGMTAEDQIAPELERADADEVWTARDIVAAPGGLGAAGVAGRQDAPCQHPAGP